MSAEHFLGQSTEDYLKAIFKLQGTPPAPVSTSRISQALKVSPAAVTKAMKQLSERSLITHEPYRGVSLTETGSTVAVKTIRRHRLIELFLHVVLGYSWDEVDAEAERLEHHISELFEKRIDAHLNFPSIDPHGDPIPSADGTIFQRSCKPLSECAVNRNAEVIRVSDRYPEILQYLNSISIKPGVYLTVVDKQPFDGPFTILVDKERHMVGPLVAGSVYVQEDDGAEVGV